MKRNRNLASVCTEQIVKSVCVGLISIPDGGAEVGGATVVLLHLQRKLRHETELIGLCILENRNCGELTVRSALTQINTVANVRKCLKKKYFKKQESINSISSAMLIKAVRPVQVK